MTDREMLELAAKAAGLRFPKWSDCITDRDSRHYGGPALHGSSGQFVSWNPLEDDGDALRLAVKLRLHLGLESDVANAWPAGGYFGIWASEPHNGDAEAATRRAIVRAAASIGEQQCRM